MNKKLSSKQYWPSGIPSPLTYKAWFMGQKSRQLGCNWVYLKKLELLLSVFLVYILRLCHTFVLQVHNTIACHNLGEMNVSM